MDQDQKHVCLNFKIVGFLKHPIANMNDQEDIYIGLSKDDAIQMMRVLTEQKRGPEFGISIYQDTIHDQVRYQFDAEISDIDKVKLVFPNAYRMFMIIED